MACFRCSAVASHRSPTDVRRPRNVCTGASDRGRRSSWRGGDGDGGGGGCRTRPLENKSSFQFIYGSTFRKQLGEQVLKQRPRTMFTSCSATGICNSSSAVFLKPAQAFRGPLLLHAATATTHHDQRAVPLMLKHEPVEVAVAAAECRITSYAPLTDCGGPNGPTGKTSETSLSIITIKGRKRRRRRRRLRLSFHRCVIKSVDNFVGDFLG